MRDDATLLDDCVRTAVTFLSGRHYAVSDAHLKALAEDMAAAAAGPVPEGGRLVDDFALLITQVFGMIVKAHRLQDKPRARQLTRIIGAALPDIEELWSRALAARMERAGRMS